MNEIKVNIPIPWICHGIWNDSARVNGWTYFIVNRQHSLERKMFNEFWMKKRLSIFFGNLKKLTIYWTKIIRPDSLESDKIHWIDSVHFCWHHQKKQKPINFYKFTRFFNQICPTSEGKGNPPTISPYSPLVLKDKPPPKQKYKTKKSDGLNVGFVSHARRWCVYSLPWGFDFVVVFFDDVFYVFFVVFQKHTVDGRNPAPPGM